jgi:nucleoside-diphosphate-sugar epimerase
VSDVVARTAPDVVIHQMTALAQLRNFRHFDREFAATNALRTKGTDNLLAASRAAGVRRFIAQSFTGWSNARDGGPVKTEADPLDPHPPAAQRETLAAIRYLERTTTSTDGIEGVALRYGALYGPGASETLVEMVRERKFPIVGSGAGVWSFTHIDDAASATVAAIKDGSPGVYNIVDADPAPVSQWLPYLAWAVGARAPRRIPEWLARVAGGEVAVSLMTRIRGSSNAKAKQELGWQPAWPSWRRGLVHGLG